ncbi:MAG: hypothetical protein LBN02_03265 [Oscillospiraceae bacterium]|jgi:hypothetical protein|nr:hypothetical protein [Oscillospiraceae bacterium]
MDNTENFTDNQDNITITRMWEDTGFFAVRVSAVSESVTANVECYTTDSDILELRAQCAAFAETREPFEWQTGQHDIGYVSLHFVPLDKRGHITVKVSIESDSDTDSWYYGYFRVMTEIGAIQRFAVDLRALTEPNIGVSVSLRN